MKFDLHTHSNRSYDCHSSIEAILTRAKKCGLKGIAITDHDAVFNADIEQLEETYGIWVIPGVEVYTDAGDILGLFVSEKIHGRNAGNVIDEIHNQGGIAVLPHPFKRGRECPLGLLDKIDAIEVINSRWVNLHDFTGVLKVANILSMVQGRTGGSDAHFIREIGNAYLETPSINSKDQLRAIILEGNGCTKVKRYSTWLDLASQTVKFMKAPSLKQLFRLPYYILRQLYVWSQRKSIV